MQDRNVITTIMFFMSQCGFPGTGQTEYTNSICFTTFKVVTFHTAVACNIIKAVCQRPRKCKRTFFMLAEITHTKNHRTVMSRVKNSKTAWMTWYNIVRIRVNIDVAFWDLYTVIVEFFYSCIKELEVHEPRIQNRRVIFWNHQMSTSCEFFIKTNNSFCRNPLFIAAIIYCITCNISEFNFIYAFIANNTASFSITTCSFTIVCNKNLCISWQTLL